MIFKLREKREEVQVQGKRKKNEEEEEKMTCWSVGNFIEITG